MPHGRDAPGGSVAGRSPCRRAACRSTYSADRDPWLGSTPGTASSVATSIMPPYRLTPLSAMASSVLPVLYNEVACRLSVGMSRSVESWANLSTLFAARLALSDAVRLQSGYPASLSCSSSTQCRPVHVLAVCHPPSLRQHAFRSD